MNALASRTSNGAAASDGNPKNTEGAEVRAWAGEVVLPTYLPDAPDRNPMFLEKRVYQGSSGKVYPLPFTDRIAETATDRAWKAVWLENEYLRVLILPEIGGRIHAIEDKTTGCDLIYRQHVIKPALVGLAGPWISGGIEFNWPQHHRPATFLPVDFEIEEGADGSQTVWCSDHDPLARMKGMHGVCLHPGRASVELKVRAYNRTPFVQTFLWWANFAARVHEGYQSFLPPDVSYVADHAKRAMSAYPLCRGVYYGVDYAERARVGVPDGECPSEFVPPACRDEAGRAGLAEQVPPYPPNDLSWYANIPVPTSYMGMGSREDFFGGYDFFRQAGIVHVANHHISPGKKQWTWGNHEFGYAWDRSLTDTDGPYIELMAGVYTDNQPDFSFLQPGETKTWSQFWFPIQKIGPARHANRDAAVRLDTDGRTARIGVCVAASFPGATVRLERGGVTLREWKSDLTPSQPFQARHEAGGATETLTLRALAADGVEIISYTPRPPADADVPPAATEPPAPSDVPSADELYLTGLHLEQYRHATRSPVPYWEEALRRDPGDARCHNALGLWRLRRGEYAPAERHFRDALARLTRRNPNPADGEASYNLGLCLRFRLDALPPDAADEAASLSDDAYAAFYKAAWDGKWAGPAFHALAEMACRRGDWDAALDHLARALRRDADNLRARDLQAVALRRLGRDAEAQAVLRETLALDPLDWWARFLNGDRVSCDAQAALDIAHDCARAGFYAEAIALLQNAAPGGAHTPDALPTQGWGTAPLLRYTLGWVYEKRGRVEDARAEYRRAAALSPDYCFPYRLEEIAVFEAAMRLGPEDARAPYYLGCLLYDRRRHEDALALWERSARLDPDYSVAWRCLGIGYFNVAHSPQKAADAYDAARRADPSDARLLFEQDQLRKRVGERPEARLRELERWPDLVSRRDDLTVELCSLLTQTGQPEQALELLAARNFQPWEGGEGQALGQHVRAHLALGRCALTAGDPTGARAHFEAALTAPPNLGEGRHLLANQSEALYCLGEACAAGGDPDAAARFWTAAATFKGDFQEMSVRLFSEMTLYSALAWERLGQGGSARRLLTDLRAYAEGLQQAEAKIDYFATSLPTMLLFDDDLQARQETTALFLQAQAASGLGERDDALGLLDRVLARDPGHAPAADLRREMGAQTPGTDSGEVK